MLIRICSQPGKDRDVIVTIEDGIIEGGWGQNIASYLGFFCAYAELRRQEGLLRPRHVADLMRESSEPEVIAADVTGVGSCKRCAAMPSLLRRRCTSASHQTVTKRGLTSAVPLLYQANAVAMPYW